MKKLFRFGLVSGLLLVGLLVIAGVALKVYFNEERLRSLILPPMREALGREVEIASLQIDLLSGVKVAGLVIKEADGEADFVVVKEFSLGYSLWPLFEKRLEISRVRIGQPVIKIWRNREGLYNYSDLQFLQAGAEEGAESGLQAPVSDADTAAKVSPAALPLALVVQRCEITDAILSFHDELGELPEIDLEANLKSRLDLGDLRPESINADGKLDFSMTAEYHSLTPQVQGTIEFDRQKMVYEVFVKQENEECTASGSVSDYLAAKPAIILNLDSPRLDLAYLAALAQQFSASGGSGEKSAQAEAKPGKVVKTASAPPSPPSLTASGEVDIKQAVYEKFQVENFILQYYYEDALLRIKTLQGELADGSFAATAEVQPFLSQPDFQGDFSFADIEMSALMEMAAPAVKDNLSGAGYGQFKFSGRGATSEVIQKNLSVEGEYGLRRGGLDNLPLTKSLAQLLGSPELENLKIADLTGNLRLKDGQVNLNNSWSGDHLSGRAVGGIGLDGTLDLPLHLVLNRKLSAKMAQRYPWVKESFNDDAEAVVDLGLAGTLSKPKLRLDKKKVQKQLQKKLEKKILEKLAEELADKEGESSDKGGSVKPEDLLRQFLKE
ncbi:MAG: AsmA-like C-terminal region-containing protein [Pseudomonadota bacterium]|nr:AsmA-like C-terminal region-containing protein [Pseudomonadota bacterium]